jgi:hypothetical protein
MHFQIKNYYYSNRKQKDVVCLWGNSYAAQLYTQRLPTQLSIFPQKKLYVTYELHTDSHRQKKKKKFKVTRLRGDSALELYSLASLRTHAD